LNKENKNYPNSKYAWYMVVMLTIAYILSFVDRYILGLLIEPIKADLGLTDTQIGLLLGFAFAIFYATMGLPLGYLADRKKRTWLVAAGIAVWSAATAASGLVKNFIQLFIARMTVGAGEATLSPCAMSMISDSFPPEKRGKPIAFYTAALSLGAGIASLISAGVINWAKSEPNLSFPLVGEVAPWQFTFIVVGLPGLLLAVLFLFMREPKRIGKNAADDKSITFGETFVHVKKRWKIYGSFIAFVCLMIICAYSQGFYAPMFQRTWGWEAEKYAVWNAVVLLAVGPLTVNIAGWLSDKMYSEKNRKDAPLLIVIFGAFILVPTGVAAPLMPTAELAMAVIALNTFGIAATSATSVTALLNITPGVIRAQTVALYYMVISISGLLLGPFTVGWLSDNVFGNENLNYACAAVPLIYGILVLPLAKFAIRSYNQELSKIEQEE